MLVEAHWSEYTAVSLLTRYLTQHTMSNNPLQIHRAQWSDDIWPPRLSWGLKSFLSDWRSLWAAGVFVTGTKRTETSSLLYWLQRKLRSSLQSSLCCFGTSTTRLQAYQDHLLSVLQTPSLPLWSHHLMIKGLFIKKQLQPIVFSRWRWKVEVPSPASPGGTGWIVLK